MPKKSKKSNSPRPTSQQPDPAPPLELRTDPQLRMNSKFDSTAIAGFPVASPGRMGFRVVDDCAEEHIM